MQKKNRNKMSDIHSPKLLQSCGGKLPPLPPPPPVSASLSLDGTSSVRLKLCCTAVPRLLIFSSEEISMSEKMG